MSTSNQHDDGMASSSAGPPNTANDLKDVLKGERIFFPEYHFAPSRIRILTTYIQELGGTVLSERTGCTVILVNPRAPRYKEELDQATFLAKSYPKMVHPAVKPYHWIASSRLAGSSLPISDLLSPSPILVHPDAARFHSPVIVWVSVNVHRNAEPDAHSAQQAVMSLIERAGGLCVDKRALAELLVVDKMTNFYKTVMAEKIKYKREWQRVVERDWIEECVKVGRMTWPPKEKEEREVDSMEREVAPSKGRGPGRPTGKPRVDYTPEDDDFLCRYLAAHHPTGSWMSRKTYSNMVTVPNLQHITRRHTAQSWHEHFKKSAAVLEKRIKRFIDAGIDTKTLKTQDEGRKTKEIEEQARQARAVQPAPAAAVVQASSQPASEHTVAQKEGARLTQIASSTSEAVVAQVNVPVETENSAKKKATVKKDKSPVEQDTTAKREGARITELASHDPKTVVEQADVFTQPIGGGPSQTSVVPQPVQSKKTNLVDLASDDELHSGPPRVTPSTTVPTIPVPIARPNEDIFGSTGNRLPSAKQPTVNDHFPTTRSLSKSPKKVRIDLGPDNIPMSSSTVNKEAPPVHTPAPKEVATASAGTSASRSRHVEELAKELSTPRRLSATARFSTPGVSSSHKRSLIDGMIQSSERKRQRASLSRSERRKSGPVAESQEDETPDTVMASTVIPPRAQVIPDSTLPPASTPPLRPPAPVVTLEEWQANVATGKTVVERQKEEYKKNIQIRCDTYGLTPAELVRAMDRLPRKKGAAGDMYWADVDRGLKEKFGR